MTSDMIRSGDKQQYPAEPHDCDPDTGVLPEVRLVWMTPDPLGAVASFNAIYSGRVVRSLADVTDEDRYQALADVQKTHLQAPLEAIKMHFLIEGVDRAFTHQLVRQRTAVYAQESMRFAVLGDLIDATTIPPHLQGTERSWTFEEDGEFDSERQRMRNVWDDCIREIDAAYHRLVDAGMPAEEARGLLPHCTATRLHYITDVRNLKDHAGNRLCTQAQFHWRMVFTQIVNEIANYGNGQADEWQFKALAQSALFRPVCYQIGHCPFEASFDRACAIRERVQAFSSRGVPSDKWHERYTETTRFSHGDPLPWADAEERGVSVIPPINPAEWLLDPSAARVT